MNDDSIQGYREYCDDYVALFLLWCVIKNAQTILCIRMNIHLSNDSFKLNESYQLLLAKSRFLRIDSHIAHFARFHESEFFASHPFNIFGSFSKSDLPFQSFVLMGDF